MSSAASDLSDETLQCSQCHRTWTYTVREQEHHASRGYNNKPKRCSDCRESRRNGEADTSMDERDILIETAKAVGELRLYLGREFKALNDRIDSIEKRLP